MLKFRSEKAWRNCFYNGTPFTCISHFIGLFTSFSTFHCRHYYIIIYPVPTCVYNRALPKGSLWYDWSTNCHQVQKRPKLKKIWHKLALLFSVITEKCKPFQNRYRSRNKKKNMVKFLSLLEHHTTQCYQHWYFVRKYSTLKIRRIKK